MGNNNYPAGVTDYDFIKQPPKWYQEFMDYEPELYRDGVYHIDDAISSIDSLISELEELKEGFEETRDLHEEEM